MNDGWPGWLEVASDVLGAASGIALLIPTYRITKARALVQSHITHLKTHAGSTKVDDLIDDLMEADQSTGRFDPVDGMLLKVGVWALVGSFALKLIFHCATKA